MNFPTGQIINPIDILVLHEQYIIHGYDIYEYKLVEEEKRELERMKNKIFFLVKYYTYL